MHYVLNYKCTCFLLFIIQGIRGCLVIAKQTYYYDTVTKEVLWKKSNSVNEYLANAL